MGIIALREAALNDSIFKLKAFSVLKVTATFLKAPTRCRTDQRPVFAEQVAFMHY